MTGADALVAALERLGVRVVFGLPGVHNLAAWEALRASPIRLVSTRHEQTAAYAADGLARATGVVGVALVTTGPGAANCVTATGEAHASGSPIVVIATDIPSSLRREGVNRGVLHETSDQAALFAPVTKAQLVVKPGDDVGAATVRAAETAMAAPRGPVYLGIPTDLLAAEGGACRVEQALPSQVDKPPAIAAAVELLAAAERPLVWAGGGAIDAGEPVAHLAARLGAPLVTTFAAAGLHPSAVFPPHAPPVGELWDRADVVVGIGTDFDGTDTQNWLMPEPPGLVALNVDAGDAGKAWTPDVVVAGDAAVTAPRLTEQLEPREPWADADAVRAAVDALVREEEPQAATLLAAVDHALPDDGIVVCDMCIPGYWLGGFRRTPRPRGLQYPIGWGTLGYGFPAALGAALSGRPTLAVVGDGGFLFACGELATAVQERIALTILLVDDEGYGMLRHDGGDPFHLHTPDFVALAEAFGVEADVLDGIDDRLAERLAAHVQTDAPTLLVVSAEMKPPPNTSPRWYRRR